MAMSRGNPVQAYHPKPTRLDPNPGLFGRAAHKEVVTVTVEEEPVFDVCGYPLTVSRNLPTHEREYIIRHLKTQSLVDGLGTAMVLGTFLVLGLAGLGVFLAIIIFSLNF